MQVSNYKVYDLEESLIASGYPMSIEIGNRSVEEKDLNRANKLSKISEKDNQAHGQFLTGIRVAFDLTCSNKMWVEAERYRFFEFVSSQSTMHRITKFNLDKAYNEYVDTSIIGIMKKKVASYNELLEKAPEDKEELKKRYLEILYSNPAGFELTARITTNYRCLKNIYYQRRDHRLPEWREFCKWIETLPYAKELICVRDA